MPIRPALAATRCDRLASLFGDRLYVELQRHGIEKERRAEAALIDLAYAKGFPLVATNEPYFAAADDYEAHDALLCIAGGRLIAETDRDQLTPDHRFKTRAEMAVLFADVPEALASTVEIAERCAFRPVTRKPILPRFTVGAGANAADAESDEAAELRRQAEEGLSNRLRIHGLSQGASEEDYRARLAFEIDVITRMNYAGYFLIVADFIQWAKAEGIPVGPGRGSGAGSLVAYALTITDLDPIQFGLLFERFLNPERVSMPDFDIDFCQDGRDQVIRYVQQRYGRDQVAQIITFGTLQARGVLRDVGRVLQMPYGQVDRLTKLVPQNPAAPVTLAAAIASEPKLQAFRDEDPVVARAFDIAQRLEGLTRHASTHAAGIVISDRPLSELVPLYRDPKSDMPVTQFNMKWVEPAGLVKFDFLGLKTLTVLDLAVKLLEAARRRSRSGAAAARRRAELRDAGARRRGRRVPGGKSGHAARAGRHAPRPLRGHHRAGGAVSPGPDGEHSDLLRPQARRRRAGISASDARADPEGDLRRHHLSGTGDADRAGHGRLFARRSRSVAPRDGQEDPQGNGAAARAFCVRCDRARHRAGAGRYHLRTAGEVRRLRLQQEPCRGLCDAVVSHRLHEGASPGRIPGGVDDPRHEQHRQAQRVSRRGATARDQGRGALGQSLRPTFEVSDGTIYYALAGLKGVGHQAVELIVEARKDGLFTSLADFAARVNPRAVNKRVIESLAAAGAFDALDSNRARVFAGAEAILSACQRSHEAATVGQNDMFGGAADAPTIMLPQVEPWLPAERLRREYDAIGFFLSGHPLDDYATVLKRLRVQSWAEFSRAVKTGATAGKVAATVVSRMERRTKTGNKMGIIGLSDPTGHFEAVLFSEGLAQYREVLEPGAAVLLQLGAELQGEDVRARVLHAEPLDDAAAKTQKGLRIFVRDTRPLESIAKRLQMPEAAPQGGAGRAPAGEASCRIAGPTATCRW